MRQHARPISITICWIGPSNPTPQTARLLSQRLRRNGRACYTQQHPTTQRIRAASPVAIEIFGHEQTIFWCAHRAQLWPAQPAQFSQPNSARQFLADHAGGAVLGRVDAGRECERSAPKPTQSQPRCGQRRRSNFDGRHSKSNRQPARLGRQPDHVDFVHRHHRSRCVFAALAGSPRKPRPLHPDRTV